MKAFFNSPIVVAIVLLIGLAVMPHAASPLEQLWGQTGNCTPSASVTCFVGVSSGGFFFVNPPSPPNIITAPCSAPTAAGAVTPYALATGSVSSPGLCLPVIWVPSTGPAIAMDQLTTCVPSANPQGKIDTVCPGSVASVTGGPSKVYLSAGPAPASTVDPNTGEEWDAVQYVDQADGLPKTRLKNGTVLAQ